MYGRDKGSWEPIDLSESDVVQLAMEEDIEPVSMWWTTFDSSDAQTRLPQLLMQPLPYLTGRDEKAEGLRLPGVKPEWKVVTTLKNHHRGLNPRITLMTATVSPEEETVYLDTYKQNKKG